MNVRWSRYLTGMAALFFIPIAAQSNVGPPWRPGATVGEPSGLTHVAITKETLAIDLRPLEHANRALVEAIYHIDNRGEERTVELLFAAGSEVADFNIRLDDQSIESTPATGAKLPESWKPPERTPGLHGSQEISYRGDRNVTPRLFTVVIRPGVHTLKASYRTTISRYLRDTPTYYWQFAYVLAPAKEWGSFGGLAVTVHLPKGWHAASSLELNRDGDILQGTFAGVPADNLALTLQAPTGLPYELFTYGSKGLLLLVGIGGAVTCGLVSAKYRRSSARASALAILWGLAVLGAGILAIHGPSLMLPVNQESNYGYGRISATIGAFVVSLIVVPIGFLICVFAARSNNYRASNS